MTDWNKAKVVDLRAELKKRGLPQTGLKPILVARLAAAENEDGSESEATVQGDALKLNASVATSPDSVSPTQPLSAKSLLAAPHAVTAEEPSELSAVAEGEVVGASIQDVPTEKISTEYATTVESSQPLSQSEPERSALSSVESQEAIEDRQKRKRRSESPPISSAEVARKRFRKSDEAEVAEHEVTIREGDVAGVEKYNAVEINDASGIMPDVETDSVGKDGERMGVKMNNKADPEGTLTSSGPLEESPPRTRDTRFKDLFPSQQAAPAMGARMEKPGSRDSAYEAEPDRIISPAIHPATAGLYIRDFMRPLNPVQLKSHLATLATPPGRDVDLDMVVDFYLDQIRTHAFISFKNVSAASRVRSALHDRIWPDERTRKPLWVDFIPVEKVKQWVEEEESSQAGGRASAKKWEVYYDIDEDRGVTASLRGTGNGPQHSRKPSVQMSPQATTVQAPVSLPPRGIDGAPSGPRADQVREQNRGQRTATNLATLDQLFRSTTAKPVLYWEPVPKLLADKRLDAMEDATSKRYVRDGSATAALNRYTLEDGDVLVDRGPEIFSGIRPPRGFRGPGRGGHGGFAPRGSYRGGGDRAYDTYRSGRGGDDWRGSRDERGGTRDSRDERRY